MHRAALVFGVLAVLALTSCSDNEDDTSSTTSTLQIGGLTQCEGSVVRRVDGGSPDADALPPLESIITKREAAEAAFARAEQEVRDRYDATAVELADGFGRAWTGENGGGFDVVDVDDFGIVVSLASAEACPTDSALYVTEAGLPLFFFAP